jgi:short-subunit dehydrogenase
MRVHDAVFLITGSSGGIGAAVAAQLAGRGAHVVPHGRSVRRLGALAAKLGAKALPVDLREPDAPEQLAARARDVCWYGSTKAMPAAKIDELLTVNLLAPLRLTRRLLPEMVCAGRGSVSFIASIAGLTGVAHEAVYSATKAGIVKFAQSLWLEQAGSGVAVSVISPGAVDTEFCTHRGVPYQRRYPRQVPAARVADVVARAIGRDAFAVVAGWLRSAPIAQAVVPPGYRALARRFG